MPVFEVRSRMAVTADELYAYHASPGALRRLLPPWRNVRVLEEAGNAAGGRTVLEVRCGVIKRRWTLERERVVPGREIVDRQVDGPFAAWEHLQRFAPIDDEHSGLHDRVEYRLQTGGLAGLFGAGPVGSRLERLFRYRHERARIDLECHMRWRDEPRLTVAISGASGLIGSHLATYLTTAGHRVVRLVRRPARAADEVSWDPVSGRLDPTGLAGVDAVVNLAGVSLAGVWTPARRRAIRDSRLQATRALVTAIVASENPPRVLMSASAVGAYGSRGDDVITEQTELGEGFLADICRAWEGEAAPVGDLGVRVVHPRFGIVVSAAGGAVARMAPVFRAGLGVRFGDGAQYWSWVDLDDVLSALEWMLFDKELFGPVNVTAPEPVTDGELTRMLGRVLRRPAVLAVPAVILNRGLGGMGEEMFLASQRAVPARLRERGFRFAHPELEQTLRFEFGRG